MALIIPLKSMVEPMPGFLDEKMFNKMLNGITKFTDTEYNSNLNGLLHHDMIKIMDECDSSEKDVLQKGLVSVLNDAFPNLIGGAFVEVLSLDEDLPIPRRLLFKIFLERARVWVVIKITPLNEYHNIDNINNIIDNCFIHYDTYDCDIDNRDAYLTESLIYKLTDKIINRDTHVLRENNDEPLFLKFYKIIPVNARRGSFIEIDGEPINVQEINYLRTETMLCSVIESVESRFIEYEKYINKYRPNYFTQYSLIMRLMRTMMYLFNEYNFVHWDLHNKNFMIDPRTEQFKIYDFDWTTFKNIRSDNLRNPEYFCHGAINVLLEYAPYNENHKDIIDILGHARDIGLLFLSISVIPDIAENIYNKIPSSRTNTWLFEIVYGLNIMDPNTKNYHIRDTILHNISRSFNIHFTYNDIESYYHDNKHVPIYKNFRKYHHSDRIMPMW